MRVPIEPTVAGQLCVSAYSDESTQDVPPEEVNLSEMYNSPEAGALWNLGEAPNITIPFIGSSRLLVLDKIVLNGATLKVNYNFTVFTGSVTSVTVYFVVTSAYNSLGDNQTVNTLVDGTFSGSVNILATADRSYFAILTSTGGSPPTVTINSISFGDPSTIVVPGEQITEEICLTVLEECDSTFIPDDDIRLTEDGDFRILE